MTHFVAVGNHEMFYGPYDQAGAEAFAAAFRRYYPHESKIDICMFTSDSFNFVQDINTRVVKGPMSIIECAQLIATSGGRMRPIHIQTID
jgi:hypothetical protein